MKATLCTLFVGLLIIGCGEQAKKETWIKDIIATGLSERDEVLEDDWAVDYDVYRDGKNDGVCYEYIAREYKEFDNDELKALLISLVRTLTLEDSISNIENKFNKKKIVTLIWKFEIFYPAEDYHQDYYQNNFLRYLAYKSGCQREEILNKIWN